MQAFVLYENGLELLNGPADSGFTDTIGFADMFVGTVFAPVHQDHQQAIFHAKEGFASARGQVGLENADHQSKGLLGDTRKSFEAFWDAVFQVSAEHTNQYATESHHV